MHSSDQNKNANKWSQAANLCKNVLFSRHRGFLWVSLGIWRRITFCIRSRVPDLAKIRKVPAGSRKRSATISRMFSRSWRAIFIGFRARSARKKLGITFASASRHAKSRQLPRTQCDDTPDVFPLLAGADATCEDRTNRALFPFFPLRKIYRQNSSIFRFFFIIPVSRMLFFVVALLAPHCWLQESRRPKPQTLRLPRNPAGLNPKP